MSLTARSNNSNNKNALFDYKAMPFDEIREARDHTTTHRNQPSPENMGFSASSCDACSHAICGTCLITGQSLHEAKMMYPNCGFRSSFDIATELYSIQEEF